MHEGRERLSCCFRPRFHGVKHGVGFPVLVRFDDTGLVGSLQDENEDVQPPSSDNLPLFNAIPIPSSEKISLLLTQTSIPSLASLLRLCGDNLYLSDGRHAHALLTEIGLEQHPAIQNPLFQFHAKCRAMNDANNQFLGMQCLSVVSWNVMISSFLREGCDEEAFQLFDRMQQQGLAPTKVTYICMVSACTTDERLFTGKLMHARITICQFKAQIAVHTALLNMYGRCGSIEDSCRTFTTMEERDAIAWNAMIEVYHEHALHRESFALFFQMLVEGFILNQGTLVSMLDACTHLGASLEGKLMHRYAIDTGLIVDVAVATAVIRMYGKGGKLEEAVLLFKSFCNRDTILWNAMLAIYSINGWCRDALELLDQMQLEGFLATRITYASALNACASQASVSAGKHIHACVVDSEMELDFDVANAITNMYGKFGSIENAECIFQKMPERNVVTWSAMIAAFAEVGQGKDALQAFDEMQEGGVAPNEVTIINLLRALETETDLGGLKRIHNFVLIHGLNEDVMVGTTLMSVYCKCGDLKGAQVVFNNLPKHDVHCWTAMISSYVRTGQGREALFLFDLMKKEGVVPDRVAVANILAACSDIEDPLECERMHAFIQVWSIELDEVIGSAMLSMYGRLGRLFLSEALFDTLPKEQAATWNAMMVVHIQHGQFRRALELFYQMCSRGVVPDKDSFVSSLTACAHETSLADGEKVLTLMCNSGVVLNNVLSAALVSMYGKCGLPDIAKGVFDQMQRHGLILWNAMVGVYAQHGDSMKALQTIDDMCSQNCIPDTISSISVLNACSHTGLLDEGLHFVTSMEDAYGIVPVIDHFICVSDMLGRLGRAADAELLINHMPFQPKAVSYMSLLGACQSLASICQGERAAKCMSELASENAGPYVSLSNIIVLSPP